MRISFRNVFFAVKLNQNLCAKVMLSGKGIANPSPIAIPWTHPPVASKLGTSSLMARAQRITLRLWLALCGALHIDKSFQSASPCGFAS